MSIVATVPAIVVDDGAPTRSGKRRYRARHLTLSVDWSEHGAELHLGDTRRSLTLNPNAADALAAALKIAAREARRYQRGVDIQQALAMVERAAAKVSSLKEYTS